MQDLARIRYVARNYGTLQGLKMVPFGLFLLLMAARDLGWVWLGPDGDCSITLPLIILTMGLVILANRYYARTFGAVEPYQKTQGMLSGLALLFGLFVAIFLDMRLLPPVSLLGLSIAALLLWSGYKTARVYYLAAGAVLLVVCLLPLAFGVPISNKIFGSLGLVMKVTLGLIWTLVGLIDHFRLMKAFRPLAGGEDARAE